MITGGRDAGEGGGGGDEYEDGVDLDGIESLDDWHPMVRESSEDAKIWIAQQAAGKGFSPTAAAQRRGWVLRCCNMELHNNDRYTFRTST